MTQVLAGVDVVRRINEVRPGLVVEWNETDVWVAPQDIYKTAKLFYEDSEFDCSMLLGLTAVDYIEYFELVYHLRSMRKNQTAVMKSKLPGRGELIVSSVTDIWKGADLQEREIYDLMGIRFDGHPNMKRVLLWEGFPGHPLR
ncbi:MAG: NADH-quinone oxidoreductase subunit C, partial [Chloroflexi bacterium]|nr:NADH-quinone oxidoreductase subunit C [Chloroflexota bacterium]